jgi:hypothetical protein
MSGLLKEDVIRGVTCVVPLLEQIDWFFTSSGWTSQYSHNLVFPLARITSDHLPCKIQIGTSILKANIFLFENFWLNHPSCLNQIKNAWITPGNSISSAHTISTKFILLRRILKIWARGLTNRNKLISNCNLTIAFLDRLEEFRTLLPHEAAFRKIIKANILNLFFMQKSYWRQTFT